MGFKPEDRVRVERRKMAGLLPLPTRKGESRVKWAELTGKVVDSFPLLKIVAVKTDLYPSPVMIPESALTLLPR